LVEATRPAPVGRGRGWILGATGGSRRRV